MLTIATLEDIPFFFYDPMFLETQNIFELPDHRKLEAISPYSSSESCDSRIDGLSRNANHTSSPDVSPATVCMRDLEYHWPGPSGNDDRGSDLFVMEHRDEVLCLRERDQNL